MGKPFYADYAEHALRFYARYCDNPNMRETYSHVDMLNIKACSDAMNDLTEQERILILNLHKTGATMAVSIRNAAVETGISEDELWQCIKRINRDIAVNRVLIMPAEKFKR